MELLFIYGTLQQSDVQIEAIGHTVAMYDDSLLGYTTKPIRFSDGSYLIAHESAENIIQGKVIEISKQELLLLDSYETDAYTRKLVMLQSGKTAWVYIEPLM